MTIAIESDLPVKEQQKEIRVITIWTDRNNTTTEKKVDSVPLNALHQLDEGFCLGWMAKQRSREDGRRYKLLDMHTYVVQVDPQYLYEYSKTGKTLTSSWTTVALPMDIPVPPTLPIFHEVNAVYFVFREEVALGFSAAPAEKNLAISILKRAANDTKSVKKQVRISQELPRYKDMLMAKKHKKTIKIMH